MRPFSLRHSPNFNERLLPVDMIVLHYTGMKTAQEALDRLCDPTAQVSAHYVVSGNGDIHALVAEDKRAWHAGVSSWQGVADVNSRSIGIEVVNTGHEYGYVPFPDEQISSVVELCLDIMKRFEIPAGNIVAHSDVAPTRKSDPGELFPWKTLAENGIGLWTDAFEQPKRTVAEMLARTGYDIADEAAALRAFQRHFHPQALLNDAGRTAERLAAVSRLYQEKGKKK